MLNFQGKVINRFVLCFLLCSFCCCASVSAANIGVCIMATGKYIEFIKPLIESSRKHFCKNHQVTYFVFTNGQLEPADDIVTIYQDRLGWPYDTMMRFQIYLANESLLSTQDYIFSCDADTLFVGDVGDEFLGQRVAVQHSGFVNASGQYNGKGTFDRNPNSKAYVKPNEGRYYISGALYGGTKEEFLKIATTCSHNINEDLSQGIIALWHDESHLNRYFIDNPLTVLLSPLYWCPETWDMPGRKILALDKNHSEFRKS